METNPYRAPATDAGPLRPELLVADATQIYVDGDAIIVRSGCVLPFRCVKTSVPVVKNDMVRKDFYWHSSMVWEKCTLTYGIHPDYRKRCHMRVLVKSLIAAGGFGILGLVIGLGLPAKFISIGVIVAIVVFTAIFVGNSPLKIAKHRHGVFWIKGFSPAFLTAIQEE